MVRDQSKKNKDMALRIKTAIDSLGRGGKMHIANLCGISSQAVTGWFSSGTISKDNLAIVSKVTGYSISWLCTGKGSPIEEENIQGLGKNPVRLLLDEILYSCDLAMKHSGREFTDAEKLDIYLEGIEFAGKKQLSGDLVKHYLSEMIRKSKL